MGSQESSHAHFSREHDAALAHPPSVCLLCSSTQSWTACSFSSGWASRHSRRSVGVLASTHNSSEQAAQERAWAASTSAAEGESSTAEPQPTARNAPSPVRNHRVDRRFIQRQRATRDYTRARKNRDELAGSPRENLTAASGLRAGDESVAPFRLGFLKCTRTCPSAVRCTARSPDAPVPPRVL